MPGKKVKIIVKRLFFWKDVYVMVYVAFKFGKILSRHT